jgi:peptidoglycan/LPS O-acetylase OafA/YrhL
VVVGVGKAGALRVQTGCVRGVGVAATLLVGGAVANVFTRLGNYSVLEIVYYGNAMAVPTWFLTALFFAIAFVTVFVKLGQTRYLLPVAALVHIVGIFGMSYPMVFDVPFRTRDAFFFGFFYAALGYVINASDWQPDTDRSHLYLGAICVFFGLQLFEQYAIGYLIRDTVLSQEIFMTQYTFATVFFVFAIFAYALSNPQWGEGTVLPKVGRYALGIYLIHVPVLRLIRTINRLWGPAIGIDLSSTLLWELGLTPLVYVLSLGIYLLLAKMNVIELEGSHFPWVHRLRSYLKRTIAPSPSIEN